MSMCPAGPHSLSFRGEQAGKGGALVLWMKQSFFFWLLPIITQSASPSSPPLGRRVHVIASTARKATIVHLDAGASGNPAEFVVAATSLWGDVRPAAPAVCRGPETLQRPRSPRRVRLSAELLRLTAISLGLAVSDESDEDDQVIKRSRGATPNSE